MTPFVVFVVAALLAVLVSAIAALWRLGTELDATNARIRAGLGELP